VTFQIREATPADSEGIRALVERVFGTAMPEEEWRWKFERNPDGWRGVVGVHDGRIVGNYAGWGLRFLVDGEPVRLYSVGDVATDPSARGLGGRRGVFRAMAEAFFESVAAEVPFCFGFPGARHRLVSERIVGSQTLFPVMLREVDAGALGPPPSDMEAGEFPPESFDPLWAAARTRLSHAAVRDRERVNWRFHGRPTRYYRMVWRLQAGAMIGWAVLCADTRGETATATVVDFLSSEPDGADLPGLFACAAEEARRLGARRLIFWETPGGPGRTAIASLSGERREAGFPMIARVFDAASASRFARRLHLVPSLYDLV
jgi:GNAT superfamily N-acetyltransferase